MHTWLISQVAFQILNIPYFVSLNIGWNLKEPIRLVPPENKYDMSKEYLFKLYYKI